MVLRLFPADAKLFGVVGGDVAVLPDVEMALFGLLHGLGVAAQHLGHPAPALPVHHEEAIADEPLDDVAAIVLLVRDPVEADVGRASHPVLDVHVDGAGEQVLPHRLQAHAVVFLVLRKLAEGKAVFLGERLVLREGGRQGAQSGLGNGRP